MSDSRHKSIIFASVILGIGFITWRVIKNMNKDKKNASAKKQEGKPSSSSESGSGEGGDSSFEKYVVSTKLSNLNVRKTPDVKSEKIGSLAKGEEVFAKPSETFGWHEYSKDGKTLTGYISSQHITKK